MLKGKKIVLGVTGSIAAYKAADLASKLAQAGAEVNVVLTREAREFITPMTFRALTHRPVVTDAFDTSSEFAVEHVALAQQADAVVIAPATAHTIARLAVGLADDVLTTTVLATTAPVILAPAMESHMYENAATQENLARLKARGFIQVGPGRGHLASGGTGPGRLVDTEEILAAISQALGRKGDLAGVKVVVSAGGTQEPLDPVRHISNPSSGKMGYAIAEAARDRGAQVVLVSAPNSLKPLPGVEMVPVRTTLQMQEAIGKALKGARVLLMAAAVSDYRPAHVLEQKMKKGAETRTVEMVRNPDILAEARGDFIRVGFAAESEELIANARKKVAAKDLDLIVANDITATDSGFATDTNRATVLDRAGNVEQLPLLTKLELSHRILDRVVALLKERKWA